MFCDCDVKDCTCIKDAANSLPRYFGLKAFKGGTFHIERSASYRSQGEIILYVYEGKKAFSKGTLREIQEQVSHSFLDPLIILDIIRASKKFTVEFMKKNGDLRTMSCSYEETGGEHDETFVVSTSDGVRSFRLNSVVKISVP